MCVFCIINCSKAKYKLFKPKNVYDRHRSMKTAYTNFHHPHIDQMLTTVCKGKGFFRLDVQVPALPNRADAGHHQRKSLEKFLFDTARNFYRLKMVSPCEVTFLPFYGISTWTYIHTERNSPSPHRVLKAREVNLSCP